MKEVEILVECFNDVLDIHSKLSMIATPVGEKHTRDVYYFMKGKESMIPDGRYSVKECLRIRNQSGSNYVTYKFNHFDENGIWLYSDEHETSVEDTNEIENIFKKLGFTELVTIDNKRFIYVVDNYEIAVDQVDDLGTFLEVEVCDVDDQDDVREIKSGIRSFIYSLGLQIGEELNLGKPELKLSRQAAYS